MSAVPSLTIVTLAPATTAPDESVTVPRMVPLTDCASAAGAAVATISSAQHRKPQCQTAGVPHMFSSEMNRWLTGGPHDMKQQRTLAIGRARFRGRDNGAAAADSG